MAPFKSIQQKKYLYAKHPEIAKRWQKETPKAKRLPQRAKRVKKGKK